MSRTPWWTSLTADEILRLRERVLAVIRERFSASLGGDVEDVVQHAFAAMFRNRHNIRAENDGLFRYLGVTARNAALDRIKRDKYRDAHRDEAAGETASTDFPALEPSFAMEISEKNEEIRRFLCELDDLDRLIIWSHVVEERSIQSIARELDLSWHRVSNTVDWLVRRIRRRLLE